MPVLCYHAVDPDWRSPLAMPPDLFARQCAWIRRHRRVVGLAQLVDGMNGSARLPRGVTALTFDDGFATVYTQAWPVLRERGLPATVFLVAAPLGSAPQSVGLVDDPPPQPPEPLTRILEIQMRAARVTLCS